MQYVKRDLEPKIRKYIDKPEIIAVTGPRQAGKTTLMKKIESEQNNSNFVTFEDRDTLKLFEQDEKEFAELYLEDYNYLFIDEFQYAEDGGKKLKYLHDQYPEKKILITGSSAADMTIQGLKHLTGRVITFNLHPFSFREFLRYKDPDLFQAFRKREEKLHDWIKGNQQLTISNNLLERIEKLRKNYTVYGGYPRVVLAESDEEKETILENIVNTYLLREIRDVIGIKEDREIEDLMRALSLQAGEKTNYNNISQKTGTSHQKLKERLNILEHTFILKQVRPFYTNKQKEIVKAPKIYFYDNGFRNALINSFQKLENRKDKGELNENFFYTQTREELKYWRTKSRAEVDFIKQNTKLQAYEIKTKPKTTRSVRSFQDKYKPQNMFIMNQEKLEKTETEKYVPLIFSEKTLETKEK